MKKFSNKQVISRFHVLAFLFTLAGVGIIAKAAYVMFVQRNYWEAVSDRFVRENVTVQPTRGNIFSADGQLLSTSLPEYKIYLDFVAVNRNMVRQQKSQAKRDSLLDAKMDRVLGEIGFQFLIGSLSTSRWKSYWTRWNGFNSL